MLDASKEIVRETKRRCEAGLIAFSVTLAYDGIVSPTPLHWQQADGFGKAFMADLVQRIKTDPDGYYDNTSLVDQLNEKIAVRLPAVISG